MRSNAPEKLHWLRIILLIRSTVCTSSGRPDDGYCTIDGADIHGMALEPRDGRDGGNLVSNQELMSGNS